VAPLQRFRRPEQQGAQQGRRLLLRQVLVEELHHELAEQAEEQSTVRRALEVGPVAKDDGLEPVDQQIDVAEAVEVLAQSVDERRAHTVQAGDGLHERRIALGDHHLLRRGGDVGAQGVGLERQL